jgi:hypothetical protein
VSMICDMKKEKTDRGCGVWWEIKTFHHSIVLYHDLWYPLALVFYPVAISRAFIFSPQRTLTSGSNYTRRINPKNNTSRTYRHILSTDSDPHIRVTRHHGLPLGHSTAPRRYICG